MALNEFWEDYPLQEILLFSISVGTVFSVIGIIVAWIFYVILNLKKFVNMANNSLVMAFLAWGSTAVVSYFISRFIYSAE